MVSILYLFELSDMKKRSLLRPYVLRKRQEVRQKLGVNDKPGAVEAATRMDKALKLIPYESPNRGQKL